MLHKPISHPGQVLGVIPPARDRKMMSRSLRASGGRRSVPAGPSASVLALMGVAIGGSIVAALFVFARFVTHEHVETMGVLSLVVLLLGALLMSRMTWEIIRKRRPRRVLPSRI